MKVKHPTAKTFVLTSILFATLALPSCAGAATVVAPNGLETVEGNFNNSLPFTFTNFTSMRYQQVYGAGEFSSQTGAFYITGMAFRLNGGDTLNFTGTSSDIELRLSTTSRSVDALSATFASNIGSDQLTVYNGSLTFTATPSGPPGGPNDFDLLVTFSTSFLYDPAQGNLLLDVFNRGGNSMARFIDAENTLGDGISRAFSQPVTGSVNDLTGQANTAGLPTQFIISTIPEPRVLSLAVIMSGLVGIHLWRRPRS